MMSTVKRKRNDLSLGDQYEVVKLLDKGQKQTEICKLLNVSQAQISRINTKKDKIRKAIETNYNTKRKRVISGKDLEVEKALLEWFQSARDKDIPLSGPILRDKAKELATQLGKDDFIPTNGWFERWKERNNIVYKKCHGKKKMHTAEANNGTTTEHAATDKVLGAAKQFVSFINKCPSPFHAVDEVKKLLVAAGYKELREIDSWNIKPLDKCFLTRNQSTIIAFAVGGKYKPGNGFSIVGAHTDSPCLKVKPKSKVNKSGYAMVGVECYGGGIWHTWFDRDLTVGGRVLVKNNGSIEHRLVHIQKPIMRVPNIAIHLMRDHNEKFGPNKESQVCPVLATAVQLELQGQKKEDDTKSEATEKQSDKHQPALVKLICDHLNISPDQIMDFELCVADTQPAAIGGALDEFVFSPRLDNLLNAYTAIQALTEADGSLPSDPNIRLVCLFDNEEVGSQSAQGAASTLQELVLRRLCSGGSSTAFEEAIPKSYMISADQAHAVHPNYSDKHETNHQPALHKGIVLKFNANQRYATTAITTAILREIALKSGCPLQDFVVRNDSPCGSTIGPIMSAKLGIPTVDIGAPQLSMHSIREMCCTSSIAQSITLYKGFFENYPDVFASLKF